MVLNTLKHNGRQHQLLLTYRIYILPVLMCFVCKSQYTRIMMISLNNKPVGHFNRDTACLLCADTDMQNVVYINFMLQNYTTQKHLENQSLQPKPTLAHKACFIT
jgi:hypothetical protein